MLMLPFEAPTIFEGIHKSYFRMPRVIKSQRDRFENDDLFRQLSHESEVRYTGFKDRPLEERQMKLITNCQEGHTEVSMVQSGIQFTLMFSPMDCDFNKEPGKVHIKAAFILNGVCVVWRGWVDLQRLEGFGCIEFDEYRAYLEEAMAKQQSSLIGPPGSAATGPPPPPPQSQQSQQQQPAPPPPPPGGPQTLTHPTTGQLAPPLPPASYGNAAIAAFHQALSVGASTSLHGLMGGGGLGGLGGLGVGVGAGLGDGLGGLGGLGGGGVGAPGLQGRSYIESMSSLSAHGTATR